MTRPLHSMARIRSSFEAGVQRIHERLHVALGRALAHQPHAPSAALEVAEAPADLDAVLREQTLANDRLVAAALGGGDGIQHRQAPVWLAEQCQPQPVELAHQLFVGRTVARESGGQAFLVHHRQRFMQCVEQVIGAV